MKRYTIKLYTGRDCNRKSVLIKLTIYRMESWPSDRIANLDINPADITEIDVGGRLVLETFYSDNFQNRAHVILNNSFCETKNIQITRPIGSFRLWAYDHYENQLNTRYCVNDCDCKHNELCLTSEGYRKARSQSNSSKRCLHKSNLVQSLGLEAFNGSNCHDHKLNKILLVILLLAIFMFF